MRLHNFFIDQKIGDEKEVVVTNPGLIHQWRDVLRFKIGHAIVLLDGSGFEFVSQFTRLEKSQVVLRVSEKRLNQNVPRQEIFLYQSVVKIVPFYWIVEKVTELNVASFTPVLSDRSEKKSACPS